jgi:hypothetical protein
MTARPEPTADSLRAQLHTTREADAAERLRVALGSAS